MWKPTNQPQSPAQPAVPERPTTSTPSAPMASAEPAAPRPVTTTTADQATIGKSLVIKGEVTGSESLYIDGRVEGSINLPGNRVTVGRNGVVSANISAPLMYPMVPAYRATNVSGSMACARRQALSREVGRIL